ncbi:MAG TPA: DEAD/DEAH box helicase, partial [Pseudolysinimonas sp.]|nr:DEAD/DEAH box helicase [Pseudolysinimonas sp.]
MPYQSRAPKRATTSTTKPGSKSPKHRGYKPDAAPAASTDRQRSAAPKKPRWNSDERVARGAQAERPRGGARQERAADGRPNWEPRGKDADRRPERAPADRKRTPFRGDRTERPAYDRTERPRYDRPATDRTERPRYDRAERPTRDRNDRAERPAYNRGDRAERPAYNRGDRTERPRYDRNDRPVRRDEERAPRVHQEDVVLAKLEAQAIEATAVDGTGFGELGLGQNIVRVLNEMGATEPFPIQAATIPQALAGRDVLGRGRTGSGKTIAFGAPLVERLLQLQRDAGVTSRKPGRAPRALIL